MSETLYEAIKAAGVPLDHHESDLYFLATDQSREILSRYPVEGKNARPFISQTEPHKGKVWIEVPFAYQPFWEARAATKPEEEKEA